jgi:glyoxylase-like metal-dependent hydrolase (beta-lactamase superfamily II)
LKPTNSSSDPTRLAANNASEWTGPSGNNTYLFSAAPSALIDAGVGDPDHVAAIERELAGAALDLVLITHGHVDHAAGAPELARLWPRLVVRGGGMGDPLRDGELFEAGAHRLRAVHTPGHAPDHFCLLDESTRDLYCGDLVRVGGTVVIPASRGGNLREYLDSLHRVRDLRPARLLPGHGPAIQDPAAVIDDYLEHRQMRERQILAALDDGCRTPAEIVSRVYPGLSPALAAAAEDTVLAHLQKLRG